MTSAFEMNPEAARSELATADAATAVEPSSSLTHQPLGGYTGPGTAAIRAMQVASQAKVTLRTAANTINRETSVTAVEAAEAANSGTLET